MTCFKCGCYPANNIVNYIDKAQTRYGSVSCEELRPVFEGREFCDRCAQEVGNDIIKMIQSSIKTYETLHKTFGWAKE